MSFLNSLFGGSTNPQGPQQAEQLLSSMAGSTPELAEIYKLAQAARQQYERAGRLRQIGQNPSHWGSVIGTLIGGYRASKMRGEADENIAQAIEKQLAYEQEQKRLQAEAEARQRQADDERAITMHRRKAEVDAEFREPKTPNEVQLFLNDPEKFRELQAAKAAGRGPSTVVNVGTEKEAKKNLNSALNIANTMQSIRDAQETVGGWTAGVGSMLSGVPGTPARDVRETLKTIQANLGFDRLQAMRDASPTGGALGQVAIQELQALQASVASLDQGQSPERLQENLAKIERHYNVWAQTVQLDQMVQQNMISPEDAMGRLNSVIEQYTQAPESAAPGIQGVSREDLLEEARRRNLIP